MQRELKNSWREKMRIIRKLTLLIDNRVEGVNCYMGTVINPIILRVQYV